MNDHFCLAIAQLDFKVGAILENVTAHIEAACQARDEMGAKLIVFPELSLTGYPPEDLLLRQDFIEKAHHALNHLKKQVQGIAMVVGLPTQKNGDLYNTACVIQEGNIIARYDKHFLPNYAVFDEARYFTPGTESCVFQIDDYKFGLIICEDTWFDAPMQLAKEHGAEIMIVPNASPYATNKMTRRLAMLQERTHQNKLPIVYVNQVGGQDELIFDGSSMVVNAENEICFFAGSFNKGTFAMHFNQKKPHIDTEIKPFPTLMESIYEGLQIAMRDYIQKNGFKGALLGVSGGIDSALTAAIAVDAIGKENVLGVLMPSKFTSKASMDDGMQLVTNLSISHRIIPIDETYQSFLRTLELQEEKVDVTKQNIQARCRAVLLMAISNETNQLLLSTGNRSELATGYCTLYGDMAGGFAVLKDIPKTMVYELAKYRNSISPVIPEHTITRPPTAELAPDQLDQDTLPPYPVLDEILYFYLNEEQSVDDIVKKGFDEALVKRIIGMVHKNEYKRRQGAVGPRINLKAFGKDRRFPITHGFKG